MLLLNERATLPMAFSGQVTRDGAMRANGCVKQLARVWHPRCAVFLAFHPALQPPRLMRLMGPDPKYLGDFEDNGGKV